jgi:hypothetical protein
MPGKENKASINLSVQEVIKVLCPKCQEALRKLIADRIADKIVRG